MARLMSISLPGAEAAAVGFDTPLAMLAECHRRVEDLCATLRSEEPASELQSH